MKRKLSQARVLALQGYTIKTDRGKFYVAPTGLKTWSGPYKSLQHATTAITRKLAREFTSREERARQLRAEFEQRLQERRHA